MMDSAPMYSISYHKPERLVRLTWLVGTAGMTNQDFKETLETCLNTTALLTRASTTCLTTRIALTSVGF